MKKRGLLLIFLLAILIRFWWFPENAYFGFDQARDAFISQEIYQRGDWKIIGPSSGKEGLYHGPLFWYLIGPLYLLSGGNPAFVLGLLSMMNALGVFLVFYFAEMLFDQKAAWLAAILYALSFSQTQYALYFANPSLAVLTITLFYLGWGLLILKKKSWAWVLIGLGLGLSIQFQFFLIYLVLSAGLISIVFFKDIHRTFNFKYFLAGLLILFFSLSTFFLAEVKYDFRTIRTLTKTIFSPDQSLVEIATSFFWERLGNEIIYGIFGFLTVDRRWLTWGLIALMFYFFWRKKKARKSVLFLFCWIISNSFLDFLGAPQLYYVNIGISVAIILFLAFVLAEALRVRNILGGVFLALLLANNLFFVFEYNPRGPIKSLYVQEGMLLEKEKLILDKVYNDADGESFVFNALTMPYKINTTWAYLFSWYGQGKYGYLPFWGGEKVPGFPGELPMTDKPRDYPRYTVFEPLRGIPEDLQKEFSDSENGFGLPVWEIEIDNFLLQKREEV